MTFLLPGVGAQGADIESLMKSGRGGEMIINSSRGIIYASDKRDFVQQARAAALDTRDQINQFC